MSDSLSIYLSQFLILLLFFITAYSSVFINPIISSMLHTVQLFILPTYYSRLSVYLIMSTHSPGCCIMTTYTNRARVTGSSDTLTTPELLATIQDWLTNDGTFLYTYNGRIRLRADPHCPLEITSFSEPECGEDLQPHPPPDEL